MDCQHKSKKKVFFARQIRGLDLTKKEIREGANPYVYEDFSNKKPKPDTGLAFWYLGILVHLLPKNFNPF